MLIEKELIYEVCIYEEYAIEMELNYEVLITKFVHVSQAHIKVLVFKIL